MEVLVAASDRVWVSHQAAHEFWRNRMSVIDDRKSASRVVTESLEKNLRSMQAAIRTWAKQTAVPEDVEEQIAEQFAGATTELRESIERESAETGTITYDAATDSVVRRLRPLLQGRVGPPLPPEEFQKALATFAQRAEQQVPPGFADAGKVGHPEGGAGDYLVWLQSLTEAKRRGLPLVIVTGDEKDDWWWKHRGQFVGPRPELVEECMTEIGLPLFMLRPADLISNASAVDVAVREDVRNEIERATEPADEDLQVGEDDSDAPIWNAAAVHELLRRLDEEGAVQAGVIRQAAQLGGLISRTEIYEAAGYDEDRMLRGFTRPSARVTKDLQAAGLLEPGVTPMLTPKYFTGVTAKQFAIPTEVVGDILDG
ncbi:MAG: PIN-like domain-containing protein [Nocardioidaceae bacterium]